MAAKKRVGRCSRGVSATDLAQMGVCERLVKFEHHCGRRPRPLGRRLIALYDRSAPQVCGFLERRPSLRPIVRWMLCGFAPFAARWLAWQEHLHDQ